MKKYEVPELKEIQVQIEDVIAVSGTEGNDAGDKGGYWNPFGEWGN